MEFPSGALSLQSPLYIERPPVESLCYQNIDVPGSLTRIKGPRHMGKSSLLIRLLAHARTLNFQTVLIDFQSAEDEIYSDLSRFLRWFCSAAARQLKLSDNLDDYWDDETGAKLSTTIYFEEYLLALSPEPIVLALNEVNRVFEHPDIARDFLPLLRFWYEQAKHDKAFQKLRTLVVHSTDIYVPLNIHHSPFNVGLPIHLGPFDTIQVKQLVDCYGVSTSLAERQSLRALVGGHPYLLSVAFYMLRQGQVSLPQLIEEAPTAAGIYHHHLQACLQTLQQQPALAEALRWVVTSPNPIELESAHAHQLASLGIVTLEGNACRPACELYRLFFTHHGLPASSHQTFFQQLRAENEQLKVLANVDGLTQLANRRMFDAQYQKDWQRARQQGARLALIMLDIDCFKLYNDTYGHPAGDECLRRVAQLLQTLVHREWLQHSTTPQVSNTVARYGGEEFVIILPALAATIAVRMAEELRDRICALQIPHATSLLTEKVVTSSIGIASVIPSHDTLPEQLIIAADSALYISKQQGRNRVSVHDVISHHTPQIGEVRC